MVARIKIAIVFLLALTVGISIFTHLLFGFPDNCKLYTNDTSGNLLDFISLLRAMSREVQLLRLEVSHSGSNPPTLVKFSIFENDTSKILTGKFRSKLIAYGWKVENYLSPDPRLLSKIREKSVQKSVTSHIVIHNTLHFAHLSVLIPRYDYYWIAGLNISNPWGLGEFPRAIDASLLTHLDRRNNDSVLQLEPSNKDFWLWYQQYSKFLECDYENIVWPFRRFLNQYVEYHNESLVRSVHQTIRRLSLKHKTPIQLYAGSLLGWYRNCDFIPYSKDVDVVLNETSFTHEFFKDIWTAGELKMKCRFSNPGKGFEVMSHHVASGIQTDLFSMQFEPNFPNESYVGYYVGRTGSAYRFTYPIVNEVCTGELLGVLVYVPCDPEAMLNADYPEGWFLPRKQFSSNQMRLHSSYNKTEWATSMYHYYKNHSCVEPTMISGCD